MTDTFHDSSAAMGTTAVNLTARDLALFLHIKDPEASLAVVAQIDASLPKDPHIAAESHYQSLIDQENSEIRALQLLEASDPSNEAVLIAGYKAVIENLGTLIARHSNYASARNNRAQAFRTLYGDVLLVRGPRSAELACLIPDACAAELDAAAALVLEDLDTAINLLTPIRATMAVSPQAAKTLAQAYTQRGALHWGAAKALGSSHGASPEVAGERLDADAVLRFGDHRKNWTATDLEEAASRDFMMAGRYGNEIARSLAVSLNPTAKLCGEIVAEAMRKELGGMDS